ncbi:MAG: nucleotide exchange factor GrpE [Elusimicrobiaceae bacterium]|nr:nucleotide exchange factor GrpE [Elusimicrobiaceae bacterium]
MSKKKMKEELEEELVEEHEPLQDDCEEKTQEQEEPLNKALEEEKAKAQNYLDQLLHLQADFENYRKRTEKEKPLLISFGKAEVLKSLLPMYDNLLKAKGEFNKEGVDLKHLQHGLSMILEEVEKSFKAQGLKVLNGVGKPYNPMTQEVITTVPCPAKDDGKVLQELVKAVELDGKIIRPAQVVVCKTAEVQDGEAQNAASNDNEEENN